MSYSTRFDTLEEYVQALTKQVSKIDKNQRWVRGNEINWTKAEYDQYVHSYRAAKESLHCMILILKQKHDKWVADEVDFEQDSGTEWSQSDAERWDSDVERDDSKSLNQDPASTDAPLTISLQSYETMAKMLQA